MAWDSINAHALPLTITRDLLCTMYVLQVVQSQLRVVAWRKRTAPLNLQIRVLTSPTIVSKGPMSCYNHVTTEYYWPGVNDITQRLHFFVIERWLRFKPRLFGDISSKQISRLSLLASGTQRVCHYIFVVITHRLYACVGTVYFKSSPLKEQCGCGFH